MRIAAVADDVTGATDLAGSWRSRGFRTAVVLGELSEQDHALLEAMDAVVFAVKIRSVRAADARDVARRIGSQLREFEGVQVYDKYCSTFDSTAEGNIGPIADELAEVLGAGRAVVVPSMPANGRTVYQGTLFVHDQPLSESPMRDHPLNPMRDSDLVRLLQAQTARPVGLIPWQTVRQGPVALR
ncbi:MAG: four-carbon acid sugar kinase family protein, partial [Kocuria sp.]|nr:four-carbon acid sugar kinase family protein [Kocuria sp.]